MKKMCLTLLIILIGMLTSCSSKSNKQGVVNTTNNYDKEAEEYSIVFKDVDDKVIDFKVLKYNQEIILPTPTEKSSPRYEYEFIGWDYNSDNQIDDIPQYVSFSFVAKAVYKLTYKNYGVTFNLDCDSFDGKTFQYVNFGSSAVPPTNLIKKGYTFEGWDSSYDYITGEKTINAKWSPNQYKINFNIDENAYLIERNHNYYLNVNYNYFQRLPIPKYIRYDKYFEGWEYNGKQITNFAGDLFEPLVLESDIVLNPIFSDYTVNNTYKLGYLRTNVVTDESLLLELEVIIAKNNIDTQFFYEGKIYEKNGDSIYENKEIEYIYVTAYKPYSMVISAMPNYGAFISKEVLFYDYISNKDTIINKMNEHDNIYPDTNYYIPYDYFEKIDTHYHESFLKDINTETYFPSFYSTIEISSHLALPSLDSFLICNTQIDTSLKLLDSQGNINSVNNTEKYGYRIVMHKITGLQDTFGTIEFDKVI